MDISEQIRALIREVVREEMRAWADSQEPEEYVTVEEAAAFASVAPNTIRRWIREGSLQGYRAGNAVRVLRSDLLTRERPRVKKAPTATPEELAAADFGG